MVRETEQRANVVYKCSCATEGGMKLKRRSLLHLAAGAAVAAAVPRIAAADNYPTRPMRLIVGYTAGSAPDIIARIVGQAMSDHLGQSVVVEDRPGAGTNLSTEAVVRAAPDGYTLLLVATPNIISGLLHTNLSFDFRRDILPVASIGASPFVVIATPSLPVRTIPELIAYAKAHPGQINFASNGTGNLTHIAGELFKMLAGVDLFHVPYHGEVEAQNDLLSGRAQLMFDPIQACIGSIKAGKLRALAVTTPKPTEALPGVPTVAETVPDYVVEGWLGIGAPAGTPAAIIDKLNNTVGAAIADANARNRLAELGTIPTAMTPDAYRKLAIEEDEKWAKVIKFAGIKMD
jgi:tripartite-type tricarboxylate transporter receptor subunit TctC